jgi:DNA-binding response OmpR family regulator
MTKPLALLVYEQLLPGSQLVNRLQDLGYRVLALNVVELLVAQARQEKPLLALVDLAFRSADACAAIHSLRSTSDTAHVPVIAFCDPRDRELQKAARTAGATLIAASDGILDQLPALLEQALQVD